MALDSVNVKDDIRCNKSCTWPTKCASCTQAKIFIHPLPMPYSLRNVMLFSLNSSFESYQEVKYLHKTSDWFQVDNYVRSLYSIFKSSGFKFDSDQRKIILKYMLDIICNRGYPFLLKTKDGWVCTEESSLPSNLERANTIQDQLSKKNLLLDEIVELLTKEWNILGSFQIFKILSSDIFDKLNSIQIAVQLFFYKKLGKTFPGKRLAIDSFCFDFLFGNL